MNFLSTHCTACLRQINAYILYSSSYRLLRGLHLLVSPLSVLGLVSCVSIVLFMQIIATIRHLRQGQAEKHA